MKIVFLGSSQKKHVADLLGRAGCTCITLSDEANAVKRKVLNLCRFLSADMVYGVGGEDYETCYVYKLARLLGKKVVIHWIGTDVMLQMDSFRRTAKTFHYEVLNLAVSEQLKEELKSIGIKSTYLPIVPPDIVCSLDYPMPQKHAVLVYLPMGKEEFYGWSQVKYLAGENPDIPFYIVANDGIDEKNIPKNIFFMGTIPHEELFELYKRTSILLRVPEHDGLPVMMLEAQGIGRTVIHNIGFPYVVTPKDRTNISLYDAFQEIVSLPPKLDVEAKRYVEETFSPDKILMLYRSIGVIG